MSRQAATHYAALRLNHLGENSWAVVERPSGAIALDCEKRLLVRLLAEDARRLAADMTAALRGDPEAPDTPGPLGG